MTAPVDFGWMSLAPATQDAITAAAGCPCRTHPCTCDQRGGAAGELDTAALREDFADFTHRCVPVIHDLCAAADRLSAGLAACTARAEQAEAERDVERELRLQVQRGVSDLEAQRRAAVARAEQAEAELAEIKCIDMHPDDVRGMLSNARAAEGLMRERRDHFIARAEQAEAITAAVRAERAHRYHADGRCRICGARPDDVNERRRRGHSEWCRYYVGPLTHEMHYEKLNETFGGADYRCRCGGYFRQGGMAGKDGDPVCPHADETYRDIDAISGEK